MKRTTQITISALATLAVTAALVAPASGYESVNASENPAASTDRSSSPSGTSINAIEGGSDVGEPVVVTSTNSTGFDWDDALIGAGSALVLVLFTGGAMTLVRRRRAPRVQPTA